MLEDNNELEDLLLWSDVEGLSRKLQQVVADNATTERELPEEVRQSSEEPDEGEK